MSAEPAGHMEETATSHGGVGEGFMVVTSELLSDMEGGAGGQKRVCMVF